MSSDALRERIRASLRAHYGDRAEQVEAEIWRSDDPDGYVGRFVAAMCAAHDATVRAEVSSDADRAVEITTRVRVILFFFKKNIEKYSSGSSKQAMAAASLLPAVKTAADAVVYNCATKCRVCKSNNVMERSVQTRSADEPATIKFVCQTCDAEWSV